MTGIHYQSGRELDTLDQLFPSLRSEIVGKDIVDFGCGHGYQAIALARAGARHVLGIELDEAEIEVVRNRTAQEFLSERVSAERTIPDWYRADIVISKYNCRRRSQADASVSEAKRQNLHNLCAAVEGALGAHMGYFCRLPWVHLLFSERTIMDVRRVFRRGPELTYGEIGLSRMSLSQFEPIIAGWGLRLNTCTMTAYGEWTGWQTRSHESYS
jgi:SAM-dependent methyltransferase